MIKLDDNLLQELGLAGLPAEEKKKMLAHIYETLEMRVGMKLAEQMTDEQLREFEQFIDSNDEAGALRWLETNFPNYKDVVSAEFNRLKSEIQQVAPQIVASGQQTTQQGSVDQAMPRQDLVSSGQPAPPPVYGADQQLYQQAPQSQMPSQSQGYSDQSFGRNPQF